LARAKQAFSPSYGGSLLVSKPGSFLGSAEVVTRYRIHLESGQLAPATINVRLAAVRRLAYEAADSGLLSPDLAAGIRRVKGAKKLGVRLGNWLTAEEARRLWQSPGAETLKGKRDRALLSVLLGCGLRRRELAELTVDVLQRREDHWAIVDLIGKGGHIRTVPVPDWVKQTIDEWLSAAGIVSGRVFRCVCRAGKIWGNGMSERVVWHVVKKYASKLNLDRLAPHDLRRSCARLCHAAGGEMEQIQFLLGHVSVQTTERYLGCRQRLRGAVNDRIGIEPWMAINGIEARGHSEGCRLYVQLTSTPDRSPYWLSGKGESCSESPE
jgi:site-specific recombinase XerD